MLGKAVVEGFLYRLKPELSFQAVAPHMHMGRLDAVVTVKEEAIRSFTEGCGY